ncbi:YoaK family protein [Commensalibacter nepenthis]|uniref:YoaK family protein n=1 Tax=Commensalibacter nepenthis TaxID=3043872 RepID=UPI0038D1CE50
MHHKYLISLYMLLFTFIGGFSDASSYLISGIFTGHLTGNLVLSTVYAVNHNYLSLFHSIMVIIGFTSGTMLGVWFRTNQKIRFVYKTSIALLLQLVVIICVFVVNLRFYNDISHIIFFGSFSFTLGLQNGTINNLYKIGIHSSYITGMSTNLINNYFTLHKDDPNYTAKIKQYIMQFYVILAFIIRCLNGCYLHPFHAIYRRNYIGNITSDFNCS